MINEKVDKYLFSLLEKYNKLDAELKKPETISNLDLYKETKQKMKKIEKLALLMREWKQLQTQIEEWINISQKDNTLKTLALKEIQDLKKKIKNLEKQIAETHNAAVEEKSKNTILEIRSAAGGRESSIFAEELLEMYLSFCENKKWKYEIWNKNKLEKEGISFATIYIMNKNAYQLLKHEGGVHRVQRVPKTESSGRIHTSTVTIAVLKESTEEDMPLLEKDLRIDTFRSSGAGGQHVNTTDSGVRITHIPSGLSVASQAGRSQHDNKDKAKKLLRSRLGKIHKQKGDKEFNDKRKEQVKEGDRSDKIRTYNFLQNRVTDHRINFTEKNIQEIMNGKLDKIINELKILNEEKID